MSSEGFSKIEIPEDKIARDREQYEKVKELMISVNQDPHTRLPYIPAFYRSRKPLDQIEYLSTTLPLVYKARNQEFCLETCNKKGNECFQQCQEFTTKAYELGMNLFANLHKPYRYSSFASEEE